MPARLRIWLLDQRTIQARSGCRIDGEGAHTPEAWAVSAHDEGAAVWSTRGTDINTATAPCGEHLTESNDNTPSGVGAPRSGTEGAHDEAGEHGRDDRSVEQRVRDHIDLVSVIVRDFARRIPSHVQRNDLTSAGNLALVQAAQAFDPSRGIPFDRYAARRIRGALVDELRSYDWASRDVRRIERTLNEAHGRLVAATGHAPDDAALAAATGISAEQIEANRDDVARAAVHSVDIVTSAGIPMAESLTAPGPSPEESLLRREKMLLLVESIRNLPHRHRRVIEDYYFHERPMAETAEDLGVTDSRISQIRAEAVRMLHDAINYALSQGEGSRPPLSIPSGETKTGRVQWRRRMAYVEEVASSYRVTSPLLPRPAAFAVA